MTLTKWTILIPIHNLDISHEIGGEINVDNVLFVSVDKIPRVRRRLGIYKPISEYKNFFKKHLKKDYYLKSAKVYAVIRTKRESSDSLEKEFSRLKDSIYLLASSQFFSYRRNQRILFGSPEFANAIIDDYYLFENDSEKTDWKNVRIDSLNKFHLDNQWKKMTDNHFFKKMLKIINGKMQVSNRWRYTIRRASILAGQSQFARNIWEAFLYDIIAIELLLTNRGEDIKSKISERLTALFGWITDEKGGIWKEFVDEIYGLRSEFVHKGSIEQIKISDVIAADTILYNLLYNICHLTNHIKNKNDIIELSEKIKARKTLGLPYTDRPKNLKYTRHTGLKRTIKTMKNISHWQGW